MAKAIEFDPARRDLLRKGAWAAGGLAVAGVSLGDLFLVTDKREKIKREAETTVQAQGVTPPNNVAVREANLTRDGSNNIVQVKKEPVTPQQREIVAQQAVYDWQVQLETNNNPEAPFGGREIVDVGGGLIGTKIFTKNSFDFKERFKEWRNTVKARREDQ